MPMVVGALLSIFEKLSQLIIVIAFCTCAHDLLDWKDGFYWCRGLQPCLSFSLHQPMAQNPSSVPTRWALFLMCSWPHSTFSVYHPLCIMVRSVLISFMIWLLLLVQITASGSFRSMVTRIFILLSLCTRSVFTTGMLRKFCSSCLFHDLFTSC